MSGQCWWSGLDVNGAFCCFGRSQAKTQQANVEAGHGGSSILSITPLPNNFCYFFLGSLRGETMGKFKIWKTGF